VLVAFPHGDQLMRVPVRKRSREDRVDGPNTVVVAPRPSASVAMTAAEQRSLRRLRAVANVAYRLDEANRRTSGESPCEHLYAGFVIDGTACLIGMRESPPRGRHTLDGGTGDIASFRISGASDAQPD
jgi:hypothetical protein